MAEDWSNPPIASGASSLIRRVRGGKVAKIFHAGVSEEMIDREYRAATLAAECGIAVARPIARVDADDGRAILYPEVSGPTLLNHMQKGLLRARSAMRRMVKLHRHIHDCHVTELRPLKQVLGTDIAYGPADPQVKEAAYAVLDRLPDGDRLLHGDFHPANILVPPDGLTAIDWSKAAQGAATPDMLRTEMLLRFGQGPEDPLTNIARDWAARHYVRSYAGLAGNELTHVREWRAVVALSWLRARSPVRQKAFDTYLKKSLAAAGMIEWKARHYICTISSAIWSSSLLSWLT